jgi:ORF6N domain
VSVQNSAIVTETVDARIHLIRGLRVMLDSDLARLYGVSTKRLKEQFRRNRERFPSDFAFVLNRQELTGLRSQIAASRSHGGLRYTPIAFTEHGAIMLASVLNSPLAIEASVRVVRAFVHLREVLSGNRQLAAKFAELETRLNGHDAALKELFDAIRALLNPELPQKPHREIGFHIHEEPVRYRVRRRSASRKEGI